MGMVAAVLVIVPPAVQWIVDDAVADVVCLRAPEEHRSRELAGGIDLGEERMLQVDRVDGHRKIQDAVDIRRRVERGIEQEPGSARPAGESVIVGAAGDGVVAAAADETIMAAAAEDFARCPAGAGTKSLPAPSPTPPRRYGPNSRRHRHRPIRP